MPGTNYFNYFNVVWLKNFILVSLVAICFSSCSERKSNDPNSTGRASEIILVSTEGKWTGPVGDSIRKTLTSSMEGLPADEPQFTLIFIPQKNFSKLLQSHRNVLIVDINAQNGASKVETLKNVWSHPQRVIKIIASSDTAFFNIFAKHREAIRELFNQNERARFSAQNSLSRNFEIEKLLSDDFGINMVIPKSFYKAKKTTDFVWLRSEATTMSLGLIIYTYPYKDTAQLNPKAVLAARDRYTKLYIPGPTEGSYMTTERENYDAVSKKLLFKNLYAVETRGLWRTEGDFMGGPFINYTIVDAPRQRIVVLDGYVYNPNKPKRNYIRELESLIWGAEFSSPVKEKSK
jgi:hypothetical protein